MFGRIIEGIGSTVFCTAIAIGLISLAYLFSGVFASRLPLEGENQEVEEPETQEFHGAELLASGITAGF